jgi:hypothetical protein
MIFVMAGGSGKSKQQKSIQYGGEICLTNVDECNYILAPE